ncbi:MAG: vacuolar membrane PQ loop repeat protein [Lasallia pustulata]|uniref:Vacuolar membrane PQ loop repeat protein n=1 Tax=Lasallia pustulata TaxID=136370 RepID=A0A5M8PN44_9LECA|nr:MAG: vacuolar membrane PQ loop repeat protein [Lasallia pustulata]
MASGLLPPAGPAAIPLTVREAVSGVLGSVSLASWIVLLVPQLVGNYRSKSAEGISLAFLTVWLVGDVANFLGAVWAGLVPTVIALAVYFCFADLVLITQCLYYNIINARKRARQQSVAAANSDGVERQALLGRRGSDNIGLPGSRRRSSASQPRRNSQRSYSEGLSMPSIAEEHGVTQELLKNGVSIFLVCAAGAAGWAIAWRAGVWRPTPAEDKNNNSSGDTPVVLGAQVLGYLSALAYLGARIPQIVKNYRDRSCEGLSLLFFILSLLGNFTFGGGILFHSTTKRYILTNLPWLIGSLGTMGEDALIFIQFHLYSKNNDAASSSAVV